MGQEVCLVEHDDELLVNNVLGDVGRKGGELRFGLRGIDHPDHHFRFVHLAERATDAHLLDHVGGVAYAGSVNEADERAVHVDAFFHSVACGAVYVADQGTLLSEQGIEQGGLAGIRFADDGHGQSALECIAQLEGLAETVDVAFGLRGQCKKFRAVGKFKVFVVGEVQLQFHERREVQKPFAECVQFPAESAPQLMHGHVVVGRGGGGNEVGHGFGLAQVHLAVEKGALREFAWSGSLAACLDEQLHDLRKDVGRGMARNLHAVLARIGVRCTHEADKHFVDHIPHRVKDVSVSQRVGLPVSEGRALGWLEND